MILECEIFTYKKVKYEIIKELHQRGKSMSSYYIWDATFKSGIRKYTWHRSEVTFSSKEDCVEDVKKYIDNYLDESKK